LRENSAKFHASDKEAFVPGALADSSLLLLSLLVQSDGYQSNAQRRFHRLAQERAANFGASRLHTHIIELLRISLPTHISPDQRLEKVALKMKIGRGDPARTS
jgi:hypothetical protein